MRIGYRWVQWAAGVDVGSHGRMVKWNDMIVTVICEIWTHYHAKLLTQQKAKGLVVQPPSQLLWLITARRIETCFSGHVHLQRIEAWTASNWVSDWLREILLLVPTRPVNSTHSYAHFVQHHFDGYFHPSIQYGIRTRWQMGCDISLWFMRNALKLLMMMLMIHVIWPVTLCSDRYWYYISWLFD